MNNQMIQKIRKDFPALQMEVYGKPLIFLDSSASSLKPNSVIDTVAEYYRSHNSNVHRGAYRMSQLASDAYDSVRVKVKNYINASSEKEIVFTKGTTEGINLLANGLSEEWKEGDQVIVTEMEHHANIIPWQVACEKKKAILKVVPVLDDGSLNHEALKDLLNEETKVLALTHVSNVLGTKNLIKDITELAHRYDVKVVVDGAQGIVHGPVDVKDLDCDFYVFSGHKFYAPMGIGILYGKKNLFDDLAPYQVGGAMIDKVSFEKTSYKESPLKFEAGTPNVGGVIGLGRAIEYVEELGWDFIQGHEQHLLHACEEKLKVIPGIRIIGEAKNKEPIVSFVVDGLHAYDMGTILDRYGVACRTGNHCTQPLHERFDISGTVRASFAFYNNEEEVDVFIEALKNTINMLS